MIQYNLVKCKAAVNALILHLTEKERLYFAARCEHEYDQYDQGINNLSIYSLNMTYIYS